MGARGYLVAMNHPEIISAAELVQRFEVLLLDAYGVLIHHEGALPHAAAFVDHLNRAEKPYYIVTNDAARLPETTCRRLAEMGLEVPGDRIISSGLLLGRHFAEHDLVGVDCAVLGPEDSCRLVELAGGRLVEPGEDAPVLVLCDELGFDFVEMMDRALSRLLWRLDRGLPVHMVAPNPDIIYPKSDWEFGFTAGGMALMMEAAMRVRFPAQRDLRFIRLGKPNAVIFQEALRRAGTKNVVMVGDQLGTDVLGANRMDLPSALVTTGLSSLEDCEAQQIWPRFVVESLEL